MIYLADKLTISHRELETNNSEARFRRATPNMIASTLLLEKISSSSQMGLIYASHFGEVASSVDFLFTYHHEKMAKPILFQNSLHNSALGFISIALNIKGPCITISSGQIMNSALWSTTAGLFQICDTVAVCLSDSIPDKYLADYEYCFPQIKHVFNQTSCFLFKKTTQPIDNRKTLDRDFQFI